MKRILSSTTAALIAGVIIAGCGSSSNPNDASASFNSADVTFAQAMIPHHQQAVAMAKLARTRAASPAVKQLADKIEAAQAPEIDEMTGWLQAWGKDTGSSALPMDGMSGSGMPGMMSDADMSALAQATGTAFDDLFLTMMTGHHQGAIEMAKTEQLDGKNPDAVRLARQIQAAQQAEITLMRSLLKS